jgi:hypothetical protein
MSHFYRDKTTCRHQRLSARLLYSCSLVLYIKTRVIPMYPKNSFCPLGGPQFAFRFVNRGTNSSQNRIYRNRFYALFHPPPATR